MSIEMHIERLVIDEAALGGEPVGRVRVALERELGALLEQPGAAGALREFGAVAALPPLRLPVAAHPRQPLGARLATAVQQGLGMPTITHSKGAAP